MNTPHHTSLLAWIVAMVVSVTSHGQVCLTRDSLIKLNVPLPMYDFGQRDSSTLNEFMRNIYLADQPFSYVAGMVANTGLRTHDATQPLREGEGRRGDLGEASVDLFFPVVGGRQNPSFRKGGFRAGTLFRTTIRMADDFSHPVLPGNWQIGFGGEWPLWLQGYAKAREGDGKLRELDSVIVATPRDTSNREEIRQAEYRRRQTAAQRQAAFLKENWSRSTFLYATWKIYHYSNGQADTFYLDSIQRRNNYKAGDFSTNCVEGRVHFGRYDRHSNLFTGALGFRWDTGVGDVLGFNAPQVRSYGQWRWVGHAQWRIRPFKFFWHLRKRYEHPATGCFYRLRERAEARIRWEGEYIAGNMANYPHQDRLQRFGTHLWLELMPMRSYGTGLFAHAYLGRDYLNIRYDRAVVLFMIGASFTPSKYLPFGWRPATAIDEKRLGRPPIW